MRTYKKINENYVTTKGMEIKLSKTAQEILAFNSDQPLPLLAKFKAHVKSEDQEIVTTLYMLPKKTLEICSHLTHVWT